MTLPDQKLYDALIVDHDPMERAATARAMAAERFRCDVAGDGIEALQRFRQRRHDLVVTELRMPRMHGYALTLALLNEISPPQVVVLTSLAEPNLVRDLLSRGAADVINKPTDARVFATKMAALFEREQWRASFRAEQFQATADAPATGHTLIAQIEQQLIEVSEDPPDHLDELFVAARELSPPPPAMISFLERHFDGPGDWGERRQSERASLLATISAIPLSHTGEACGEPFRAAARDASEGGLSMAHTRSISAEYVAVQWPCLVHPGATINLVLQVTRCQPLGPFYEVAGQFFTYADLDFAR